MRIYLFAIFLLLFALGCVDSFASDYVNETRIGDKIFRMGQVGGKSFSSTVYQFGNTTIEQGQIGGKSFNNNTFHLGNTSQTFGEIPAGVPPRVKSKKLYKGLDEDN